MLCMKIALVVVFTFVTASIASQTNFQRERFREVQLEACELAKKNETTSKLLAAFDSAEFREDLKKCCPGVYDFSAEDILKRLREEMRTVEIVTGFSSFADQPGKSYANMNVEEGMQSTALESTWEAMVKHNKSFDGGKGWWSIQDDVETKLYGLKSFSQRGDPQTMDEAKERGVYTLLNTARIASGSPLYGDVTAVLNSSFARELALVSAIDTGEWTGLCNYSTGVQAAAPLPNFFDGAVAQGPWPPSDYAPNCSSYNFSLGTLDCFEHLILPNNAYWGTPLSTQLIRLLTPKWGSVPLEPVQLYTYLEAIPAGDLDFPTGVKFMLGSFPSLFGTARGLNLQTWCKDRGWVLMWTLGLNMGNYSTNFWTASEIGKTFASNLRVLDPLVLSHTTAAENMSFAGGEEDFEKMWSMINRTRAETSAAVSNTTWLDLWTNFSGAMPKALSMNILTAGACKDVENCVGTSKASGTCVCYGK